MSFTMDGSRRLSLDQRADRLALDDAADVAAAVQVEDEDGQLLSRHSVIAVESMTSRFCCSTSR